MMDCSSFSFAALTRRRPLMTDNRDVDGLKRSLNALDLIFYGVGCSVGAGIYSLVGIGADTAGPAIALSFGVAGIACCFTSLAYAEFASLLKTAGSAYTYAYVSFGELAGWLVGWNLTLGYAVSAAVVARSWAEYTSSFLKSYLPTEYADSYQVQWLTKLPLPMPGRDDYTCCPLSMLIIGICTLVLVTGVKESSKFNLIMTILNLSVLALVVLLGAPVVDTDNWFPVFPHGIAGMARGAGLIFFAYLGFDMVSCLSEEVSNPEVNMPIGIIGSLGVSMTIYVAVAAVIVGMAPTNLLGDDVPIVNALLSNACCSHIDQLVAEAAQKCLSYECHVIRPVLYAGSRIVSVGGIFGLTTATFTCLMGQPRIFYRCVSSDNDQTHHPKRPEMHLLVE
jgi:amino acid transporter